MSGRLDQVRQYVKGVMQNTLPLMITCEEFESFILAYLEDDLPERQRKVFEIHLKVCRECREYLRAYQASMSLAKSVFEDRNARVPDDVPEDLVKAILDSRER